MFLIILGIILFALWIIGWVAFHVASAAIHILLIAAIVLFVIRIIQAATGHRGPASV